MKVDAVLPPTSLAQVPGLARAAEALGFDALWSNETQHDPFLPLAMVAEHSQRLDMGTSIAVAFARSPTLLAYTAWDLAQASRGRFILGLGTQVKAHIERRFGMTWPESPVAKLRETILALRAVWDSWQKGERLNFRGEHYRLTLMSPFFTPPPIEHPHIPIFIAGVNKGLCGLAGELADGFFVHPFHSASYLREVILPAIARGANKTGREPQAIEIAVTAFAHTSPEEEAFVRQQIAFYGSTPSYSPVMAHHGWGEAAERLRALAARGQWAEMPALISNEMLDTFSLRSSQKDLPSALLGKYKGIATRASLYLPFSAEGPQEPWADLVRILHG